ncbi:MAG TPA: alpha/beta hydrolase [Thermoanaerobaculia bacterium]|jgi:pimeloyl-ACP methyl ester carboxylesterase|nr:alpha/beta hydrolase [Thermoanaerobaculia bacterium]
MTRQTAVLIHSGGFTSRQWRKLAEMLSPGFHVIAPDLLGYGTPWPDGEPFHFRQDLDYLETLLAEPVHLVGHSYGGFLALQLALRHPERVRSIAAYEPVAFGALDDVEDADARATLDNVSREWSGDPWLAAFVEWWNGRGAWDRLNEETRNAFRAVGWKLFQEVMSLGADRTSRETYGTITAPTLVMSGELTPLASRRVAQKLAQALPDARLKIFEGVGHMGPISHAAAVNAEIVQHLTEVSTRTSRSASPL